MTWTRDRDATLRAMARLAVDSQTIGKAVGHSAQSVRLRLMTLRDRRDRERAREDRSSTPKDHGGRHDGMDA